jgi:hypothetical protein
MQGPVCDFEIDHVCVSTFNRLREARAAQGKRAQYREWT